MYLKDLFRKINKLALLTMTVLILSFQANSQTLSPPPQDKGLPYTKSAQKFSVAKIKDHIAIFAGSRYAWAKGKKVRLDDTNWHDEAVRRDGVVYIPVAFAGVLSLKEVKTDVAPTYLTERWVYKVDRPKIPLDKMRKIDVNGRPYVSFVDVAIAQGLKVYENLNGLAIAGKNLISFDANEWVLVQTIISQFDTPEKLADPDIATEYIPTLKRQGKWTDHVKVTPEQMAQLNGPETKWQLTPKSKYDFEGFNMKLLGSKVPEYGVYPRVLFSPDDIPMLAERVKKSKIGQMSLIEMEYLFKKSWWNPSTSDGQIFAKLASGNLEGLENDIKLENFIGPHPGGGGSYLNFKGQKPGIYNTHVAYNAECLTSMALYCLLTNDNVHGRQAAAAIANFFKLRESLLDEINAISDSEFGSSFTRADGSVVKLEGIGSSSSWRTAVSSVAGMNIGLALDFAGKWMTPAEKDIMHRIIAKATYGKRSYGQDGPIRLRDINWVSWDMCNFLSLAAIEGLEGFDKEAYETGCETMRSFCEWGIDSTGVVFESNGKTPGGFQFQFLSMVTLARRGENLFGHPHFRKLLYGQMQMTSPNGRVVVNSGTQYVPFSQQKLSPQFVNELKAFYPDNIYADYLLNQISLESAPNDESHCQWTPNEFTPEVFKAKLDSRNGLRMPGLTYPGFTHSVLYDTDFLPLDRGDLKLPLNFNSPVHGVFSAYSDKSDNAVWINMMVRPDSYLGAGHHHADAGMIHFSALGINWFTESNLSQTYAGKLHNQVLVDGISEPEGQGNVYPAAATYIGSSFGIDGSFATADLTNSYTYQWQTQPTPEWKEADKTRDWELDPSPAVMKIFAGTNRYKMRPWWTSYTSSNYVASSRATFNVMQYVYRSTGLVRGKHPYGIVADDLKKDDQNHIYQWTAMLNGGVWQANVTGLSQNQIALGARKYDPKNPTPQAMIVPEKGEPLLLICSVSRQDRGDPLIPLIKISSEVSEPGQKHPLQTYNRISINSKAKNVNYRILLVPFKFWEALPKIKAENGKVTIEWTDQKEVLHFDVKENRTSVKVVRDGKTIVESK